MALIQGLENANKTGVRFEGNANGGLGCSPGNRVLQISPRPTANWPSTVFHLADAGMGRRWLRFADAAVALALPGSTSKPVITWTS